MDDFEAGRQHQLLRTARLRAMAALILSSAGRITTARAMYLRMNGILPPSAQPKK